MHLVIEGRTLFPHEQLGNRGVRSTAGGMNHGSAGKNVPSHPIAQESLIDILSKKLRTLWCVQTIRSKTRIYSPTLFESPVTIPQWMETLPMLPPMNTLGISYLNFEWFENDPRPVEPDTNRMPFFGDPRRYYHSWKVTEEALGVRHVPSFRAYVCVASEIALAELRRNTVQHTGEKLWLHQLIESNRQTEKKKLEAAISYWVKSWTEHPPPHEPSAESSFRETYMKVNRDDITAIGMWVFSEEAFGQVDSDNVAKVYRSYLPARKTVKSSVTPGLAMFNLASLPL